MPQKKKMPRQHDFEVAQDSNGKLYNKRTTTIEISNDEDLKLALHETQMEIEKLEKQIEECNEALGYMQKQEKELLKFKGKI